MDGKGYGFELKQKKAATNRTGRMTNLSYKRRSYKKNRNDRLWTLIIRRGPNDSTKRGRRTKRPTNKQRNIIDKEQEREIKLEIGRCPQKGEDTWEAGRAARGGRHVRRREAEVWKAAMKR